MRGLTYFDVVALIDDLREENANLTARIAELEEQAWNLNLENERMEEAYWIDESIAPDGTSKPSVRKLLERLEKAETDLRLSDDLVKALDNRIAELEEKQRWIPVSERLPEDGKPVWVCTIWNEQHSGNLTDDCWTGLFRDFREGEVTHWMPLPELPEESKKW